MIVRLCQPLILLISISLIIVQVIEAQADITGRTIDFRNDIRILRQKSLRDVAPNIIALPVLETRRKKNISIPFELTKKDTYISTVILGDDAEVYLLLEDFHLRPDQELVVSSVQSLWEDQKYNLQDNKESGRFMIGPYRGDVVLEMSSPTTPELAIHQVYANPINVGAMELGFDASFLCHTNVNCEEGADFADEKRAVMRIRMVAEEGVALCTGTLLNNTMGDRKPYVLTAAHCIRPPEGAITPLYDMWWFDFNYESFSCANPEEEPFVTAIQGAIKVAEWIDTDMMLLLIDNEIPLSTNVFFAGWTRDIDYLPDTTALIHHPVGDIKKISFDFDTATIHDRTISWDNNNTSPVLSHYKNDFDRSTYQPGSSGSAIFDQEGHVLGQLHGGPLSDEFCTVGIGYSGRISVSWDTGDGPEDRLMDWLDPLGSAPLTIDGLNPQQREFVRLTGQLRTADGLAIPNVRVSLTGDLNASFPTGSDGRFVFENLESEGTYQLSFNKNSNARNGLSASDLVIIRNHIIGRRELENEFLLLASDVTADGNISSVDLVQIRNLIIGRQEQFPLSTSWKFKPEVMPLNSSNMTMETMDVSIIGYKMGDVNYTANPRQ